MTALGIERAHLVGTSYGGGVAMRVAMTQRASTILRGIPDAELRVLPHCRHWVQYERAPEFNHIVREFLQGGAAAGTSEG